jgi:AraC-like DNA-binding protein
MRSGPAPFDQTRASYDTWGKDLHPSRTVGSLDLGCRSEQSESLPRTTGDTKSEGDSGSGHAEELDNSAWTQTAPESTFPGERCSIWNSPAGDPQKPTKPKYFERTPFCQRSALCNRQTCFLCESFMGSRLVTVMDWEHRARKAGYRASILATQLGVTDRHLRRHFQSLFEVSPQVWIDRLRLSESQFFLIGGHSVKEIALRLGFKQSSHFCKAFKRAYRLAPSAFVKEQICEMSVRDNKCPPGIIILDCFSP